MPLTNFYSPPTTSKSPPPAPTSLKNGCFKASPGDILFLGSGCNIPSSKSTAYLLSFFNQGRQSPNFYIKALIPILNNPYYFYNILECSRPATAKKPYPKTLCSSFTWILALRLSQSGNPVAISSHKHPRAHMS